MGCNLQAYRLTLTARARRFFLLDLATFLLISYLIMTGKAGEN